MIDWIQAAPFFLAVAILIPAAAVDVREHRIPNTLCLAGFTVSIVVHGLLNGWGGLAMSAGAGLFLLIMTFPFFAMNWMGAGDVKLIGAVGAIAGTLSAALTALLGIVIAGVLMALLTIAWQKKLRHLVPRMSVLSNTKNADIAKTENAVLSQQMPYGIAIAGGTIVVMAIRLVSAI